MLIKVELDKLKKYEIDKIFEDYIPYHIIYNEIINNCIKECLKELFTFIKRIMMNIKGLFQDNWSFSSNKQYRKYIYST